ncbi:MAG: beta-ketoacyl-ACP synthase II [Verrucomicrobiae bacterium]|nr:beta-ketoacyl-ACP synthase II [Verrucomicrobiae bacterium]
MTSSNNRRRVVVTGMGVCTALSLDLETFWNAILAGQSGISRIEAFDTSDYPCHIAGEIKNFNPQEHFKSPKEARRADRFSQFAMAASNKAIRDAGLDLEHLDRDRIGVMIGSGIGGLLTIEDQHTVLMTKGPKRVSPFMIPMLIINMASGLVSMAYNLRGPNMAHVSACTTSAHSIGEAFETIVRGDAEIIVSGGSESPITKLSLSGFGNMQALSGRSDEPTKASRPFDRDRDGFVMAEGAGIVILEELEHAKKRGAKIYCELAGYGLSADAHHMSAPDPEGRGAARSMRMALNSAGIAPAQIDYINAHGTSTPQGDICETQAVKTVFGEHAKKLMVSSTKSMTGHLLGAAGAVEAIICAKVLQTGAVPPTINLDHPDPQCDLDYVPHQARQADVKWIASNSFGFGGHNATLVARKWEG